MAFYSERTMRWFNQSFRVDKTTGCHVWVGHADRGKARFSVGGRTISARRAAYAITFGEESPEDVKITLSCDERLCVNVEHFILTRKSLLVSENEKYCSRCKQVKSLDQFSPCKTGAGNVFNYCRPCFVKYKKAEYSRDPQVKERSRLRMYGLTSEQYAAMLEEQGGGCAICGQDNGERPLAVDHDHGTGRVRALLCNRCNSGIAQFRHQIGIMEAALVYLKLWDTRGAVSPPDLSRALATFGPERLTEIEERILAGEPAYRLAKEYGVNKKSISDVRTVLFARSSTPPSLFDKLASTSANLDASASTSNAGIGNGL